MKRALLRPPFFALAIALTVFLALTVARHQRLLQRWELAAYDAMLRERRELPAGDAKITIVGIDEEDIRHHDYPLRDAELAELLQQILAAEPRAIGLDLYRDLAEPRSGEGLPRLEAVLRGAENVITIFSADEPGRPGSGVPGPIALQGLPTADRPDRIAINDFPTDGSVVRRGLIVEQTQEAGRPPDVFYSLAFRLALLDVPIEAAARHLPVPELAFIPENAPETVRFGRAVFHRFHGNDGGYYEAEDGGVQFLVDYRTSAKYRTYTLAAVRGGQVPAAAFHDRVVLIGAVAHSIKDSLGTPLDPFCPGVVLHAQVVEQIRRAALEGIQPARVPPEWTHPLWTLLWALLGSGSALALLRWPRRAPVAVVGGLLVLVAVKYAAFQWGWWLAPVEPGAAYLLSAVATLAVVFAWERRERGQLMQLFSRHVSPEVATNIWAQRETFLDGGRPRSHTLTATVLFSDFVGFSTVSENMDPVELMDWLNEGMERLARHVESNGGIVNKYIGDAVMAIFGAPIPSIAEEEKARDAVNAVRCALRMGDELSALNERWKREGRPEIGMRIGICTGSLVAGSMGSQARLEFTVIGDTVNTASRLESSKKQEIPAPPGRCCRVLIAESTWRLLGGKFAVEPVGLIDLKGKANSVFAYSVLGETGLSPTAALDLAAAL